MAAPRPSVNDLIDSCLTPSPLTNPLRRAASTATGMSDRNGESPPPQIPPRRASSSTRTVSSLEDQGVQPVRRGSLGGAELTAPPKPARRNRPVSSSVENILSPLRPEGQARGQGEGAVAPTSMAATQASSVTMDDNGAPPERPVFKPLPPRGKPPPGPFHPSSVQMPSSATVPSADKVSLASTSLPDSQEPSNCAKLHPGVSPELTPKFFCTSITDCCESPSPSTSLSTSTTTMSTSTSTSTPDKKPSKVTQHTPKAKKSFFMSKRDKKLAELALKTVPSEPCHSDLYTVTKESVAELVTGCHPNQGLIDYLDIIDCRTETEYEGGHIKTAICLDRPQTRLAHWNTLTRLLIRTTRVVLVFYCDHSGNRAPGLMRKYRALNKKEVKYMGSLEMYLLQGGYVEFFEDEKCIKYCVPQDYLPLRSLQTMQIGITSVDKVFRKTHRLPANLSSAADMVEVACQIAALGLSQPVQFGLSQVLLVNCCKSALVKHAVRSLLHLPSPQALQQHWDQVKPMIVPNCYYAYIFFGENSESKMAPNLLRNFQAMLKADRDDQRFRLYLLRGGAQALLHSVELKEVLRIRDDEIMGFEDIMALDTDTMNDGHPGTTPTTPSGATAVSLSGAMALTDASPLSPSSATPLAASTATPPSVTETTPPPDASSATPVATSTPSPSATTPPAAPTTTPSITTTTPPGVTSPTAPTVAPPLAPPIPPLPAMIAPPRAPTSAPPLAPPIPPLPPMMAPPRAPTAAPALAPPIPPLPPMMAPPLAPTFASPPLLPMMTSPLAPTLAPTIAPTIAPTLAPTLTPTLAPMIAPTLAPMIASPPHAPPIAPPLAAVNTTVACATTTDLLGSLNTAAPMRATPSVASSSNASSDLSHFGLVEEPIYCNHSDLFGHSDEGDIYQNVSMSFSASLDGFEDHTNLDKAHRAPSSKGASDDGYVEQSLPATGKAVVPEGRAALPKPAGRRGGRREPIYHTVDYASEAAALAAQGRELAPVTSPATGRNGAAPVASPATGRDGQASVASPANGRRESAPVASPANGRSGRNTPTASGAPRVMTSSSSATLNTRTSATLNTRTSATLNTRASANGGATASKSSSASLSRAAAATASASLRSSPVASSTVSGSFFDCQGETKMKSFYMASTTHSNEKNKKKVMMPVTKSASSKPESTLSRLFGKVTSPFSKKNKE